MIQAFKKFTAALAFVLLIAGCQAMTGETAGQNIDDGTLTTSVKTVTRRRADQHPDTCGRRDQQRHCGPDRRSRDRQREVARWNGRVAGKGRQRSHE